MIRQTTRNVVANWAVVAMQALAEVPIGAVDQGEAHAWATT